ncbi:aminoglycoside 6-adenylyltransferase [Kineococcus sp. NBC_00420]|uniref:aminoglycoside 6-adenylyltransferase n=1 Tax=Kineococcus sp. NBC_00420 TaxID=2903564 RepID=UPI002E21E2B8
MTWHQQLLDIARQAALDDEQVIELRVHGSAADPAAELLDVWSDVDLAVLLDPAADATFAAAWPTLFGEPWALTRHQDGELHVQRVVYDDGRRLDLVSSSEPTVLPIGRLLHQRSSTLPQQVPFAKPGDSGPNVTRVSAVADEVMDVRFTAALAVVKLARADLLIGFHLGLELVRCCLVQAMVLRDRDTGTSSHRFGGPRNEAVAQLEAVRRHPWTAAGGIALVLEAAQVYDDLAVQLEPGYVSDWSGLHALAQQAYTHLNA